MTLTLFSEGNPWMHNMNILDVFYDVESVSRIDLFLSTTISKFIIFIHTPEYNVRCYYFSIRIFITPFHSRRNFRFILYSIFILRIVRIHPPRDVSFEFWLERYR